jgi:glycosyltransferase involved in cell wall biosynthesis
MICQFMVPIIEAQKKNGHYVCVCGSDDSDVQRLRELCVDVFPHQLKRGINPFKIIREISRVKKKLVEQKIDTIVCHTPIGAGVGRIAAVLAKTPNVIYFAHGLPCAPGQNILIWLFWFCIEKALGKITDAMLVMNNYDERLCKTHHLIKDTNKIFRISGMGVDLKKFKHETNDYERRQIRKELGIPEDKKIVFCVAYLIQEKGVFILLAAAEKICAQRNDIYFLLAGSGPSADKLKQKVKIARMENNFKLLGWRDGIDRLMQVADIFVLPTYYFEGLPVSILEAMACGKPVVATQHRGCEDAVVDGKTGFLVPIKDVGALADKIVLLLDNKQLRVQMGQTGREYVEENFELGYCTERILEALEEACEK